LQTSEIRVVDERNIRNSEELTTFRRQRCFQKLW